jgi:mannose-6-phosphate isomerase-like protein (cupin superfamily)
MENTSYLQKDFLKFTETIDFNFLSNLIDRNNLSTEISSNFINMYILDSVFKIKNVEQDKFFLKTFEYFNNIFNNKKFKTDFHIFFSMKTGNRSITHKDDYDVYILGLYGRTLYKVEDKEYIVNVGDLLYIPKNHLHIAIGLTPRINLSYGLL